MRTYKTLAELRQAYDSGKIVAPVIINHGSGNAEVDIPKDPDWTAVDVIFDMDLCDLISQALDLLGIPHEHD